MSRFALFVIAASALWLSAAVAKDAQTEAATTVPGAARQTQLVRMVRQDCGSCHGIQLTGGLGPALTRERMAELPLESLTAVIYHGRPGTPMPGWKSMLSEAEADWIARRLQAGFPLDGTAPSR
jgi:cytochrome c55X